MNMHNGKEDTKKTIFSDMKTANITQEDSDSDLDVRSKTKPVPNPPSGLFHGSDVKMMLEQSRAAREAVLLGNEQQEASQAPVHRVEGRIVSHEEWRDQQNRLDPRYRRERKRELDREFEKKQDDEWKRGLEQSSERMAKAEEAMRIAREPIGRSSLQAEYDADRRARDRWDDPMNRVSTKDDKSSFESERPRSRFQAPMNRFNIAPGYRWDGVIRGNEFEKRWFERSNQMNAKKTRQNYRTLD
jgi:hypothetical protein